VKPRNREVSIFNMSVLDLLTGALGAFCFLTLALFPYYFKMSTATAAENDAAVKAADELKTLNSKLESELANAKSGQKGMAAFALGFAGTTNPENVGCGGFQVISATGPGGDESLKLLPTNTRDGYSSGLNLFLLAPGTYRLRLSAYAATMPCQLFLNEFAAKGTQQRTLDLTTSVQSYDLSFEVAADDITFAKTEVK